MTVDRLRRSLLLPLLLSSLAACGGRTFDWAADDAVTDASSTDGATSSDTGVADTGVADTAPVDTGAPCPTNGAVETVPCGSKCGAQTRVCSENRWVPSTCIDKGECAAGATEDIKCPSGSIAKRICDATCTWQSTCTGTPLDVILLIDTTGSLFNSTSSTNKLALVTQLVEPLLASKAFDVRVGLVQFKDLGDPIPVEGMLAPTSDAMSIQASVNALTSRDGGDIDEGLVLALSEMAGGKLHTGSRPLTCPPGTSLGGCFRTGVTKAIFVVSDARQHNAPDGSGGVISPYPDPAMESWPSTAALLRANAIDVFALTEPASNPMWGAMEASLGATLATRVVSGGMNSVTDWGGYYASVLGLMKAAYPGL